MAERDRHKQAVRRAFDRAASSYDDAATVQKEVCHRLAAFAAVNPAQRPVRSLLDAGCGTGYGLRLLARDHPAAQRIALDFAPAMLTQAIRQSCGGGTQWPVCGDVERLPLAADSIDAVWSSLAIQWCEPHATFGELARVLSPGGTAWIATLGPDTLHELRLAFVGIDDADHVVSFTAPDGWLAAAVAAGLEVVDHARAPAFALAPDLRTLLRELKAIGAHSVGPGRRSRPLGKAAWRAVENRYDTYRRADGLLPATYDVILLALRKPL